jgi:hypothetical protein
LPGLLDKPDPIKVLPILAQTNVNWSVRTPADIAQRLEQLLPGSSNMAPTIYASLSKRSRLAMTIKYSPTLVNLLTTTLNLAPFHGILDPWAGSACVVPGLQAVFDSSNMGKIPVVVENDRWGGTKLSYEPLEPFLYGKLCCTTGLDAVISIPPTPLIDVALITALYHAEALVCMYVPCTWLSNAPPYRLQLLLRHDAEGTLLTIANMHNPSHCWLCLFKSSSLLQQLLSPNAFTIGSHVIVDLPL